MLDLNDLHTQNHRLTEISNVLLFLARDRALCDTDTVRELFLAYVTESQQHLEQVDYLIKTRLLAAADPWPQNLARKLTADSAWLRHNITTYLRYWTDARQHSLRILDHAEFVDDTTGLLELFLDRVQRETELLYPLLRKLDAGGQRAA